MIHLLFCHHTENPFLGHTGARHHTYMCSAEITSPAPPQRLSQQTLTPTKATDIRACLQCRWCRWRLTGRTAQRLLGTGRQRPPNLSLCLHLRIMSRGTIHRRRRPLGNSQGGEDRRCHGFLSLNGLSK